MDRRGEVETPPKSSNACKEIDETKLRLRSSVRLTQIPNPPRQSSERLFSEIVSHLDSGCRPLPSTILSFRLRGLPVATTDARHASSSQEGLVVAAPEAVVFE